MHRSRTAALSLAALLTIGGTTAASAGLAAAQTDPTTSSTVDPSAPTTVPVTLPGLGDIELTFDPATGAIEVLTVTPIEGITLTGSTSVRNGIRLDFTLADGTVTSRIVELEVDDGVVKVEVDSADDATEDDQGHAGPPPISERGVSAEHRNDDNGHNNGEHRGTSTTSTTIDGSVIVSSDSSTTTRAPRERDDHSTTPSTRGNGSQTNRGGTRD